MVDDDQVRDLQVTAPGKGGPILLLQNESGWTCGDDKEGENYLGELNRAPSSRGVNAVCEKVSGLTDSLVDAIDQATTLAEAGGVFGEGLGSGGVLVTGSVVTVGEARTMLKGRR